MDLDKKQIDDGKTKVQNKSMIYRSKGLQRMATSFDHMFSGVWYYLEGNDADIVMRMCDSSYDTKSHIYQDDGFNISCVNGNDDGYVCESSYLHSAVSFYAASGYTYYIYVQLYTFCHALAKQSVRRAS